MKILRNLKKIKNINLISNKLIIFGLLIITLGISNCTWLGSKWYDYRKTTYTNDLALNEYKICGITDL